MYIRIIRICKRCNEVILQCISSALMKNDVSSMIMQISVLPPEAGSEVMHACFSRHGGNSVGIYAGNNLGYHVGDDTVRVTANRNGVKKCLGLSFLVSARQVHGRSVALVRDSNKDREFPDCDALMTSQQGVGLLICHADCQAILLYDPIQKAVAAIHSGWRGSAANISGYTVKKMSETFGSRPADIVAGISPSLGPCCAEFKNYKDELPEEFWKFQVRENYFDFWEITSSQLVKAGLQQKKIRIAARCTRCSNDYFSYREACELSAGKTGRNGTVIALV